jgi:hypothetical protein
MIVKILFHNDTVKKRFIEWVALGNSNSVNSFGGSGIKGHFKALKPNEFLFFWETNFPFNDQWLLRVLLFINFRKRLKELSIKRVSKEDLVKIVLEVE